MLKDQALTVHLNYLTNKIKNIKLEIIAELNNYKKIVSFVTGQDNLAIKIIGEFDFNQDVDIFYKNLLENTEQIVINQTLQLQKAESDLQKKSPQSINSLEVKKIKVESLRSEISISMETFRWVLAAIKSALHQFKELMDQLQKNLANSQKSQSAEVTKESLASVEPKKENTPVRNPVAANFFYFKETKSEEQLDFDYKNFQL